MPAVKYNSCDISFFSLNPDFPSSAMSLESAKMTEVSRKLSLSSSTCLIFDKKVISLARSLHWSNPDILFENAESLTNVNNVSSLSSYRSPQSISFEKLRDIALLKNDAKACALFALCLHTGSFVVRDDREAFQFLQHAVDLLSSKMKNYPPISPPETVLPIMPQLSTTLGKRGKKSKRKKKQSSDSEVLQSSQKSLFDQRQQQYLDLSVLHFILGDWYRHGIGMQADFRQAFKHLKQSVDIDRKNHSGLFVLASMYERGEGVIADEREAFLLYKESATLGLLAAQFKTGQAYEWGKGVSIDYLQARFWYQKAAMESHFPSTVRLALLSLDPAYETFEDLQEAAEQLKTGSAMHNFAVANSCSRHGLPVNTIEMRKWLLNAAKSGHVRSQWLLGRMYDEGISGCKQDFKLAFYWYHQAALQGFEPAQLTVSNCYRNGLGVEVDSELADKWQNAAFRTNHRGKPNIVDHACPVALSLKETKTPEWNNQGTERPFNLITPFSTASEMATNEGSISREFINTATALGLGIVGMPGQFRCSMEMDQHQISRKRSANKDIAKEAESLPSSKSESLSLISEVESEMPPESLYSTFCNTPSYPIELDFIKYKDMPTLLNLLPRKGPYYQDTNFMQPNDPITIPALTSKPIDMNQNKKVIKPSKPSQKPNGAQRTTQIPLKSMTTPQKPTQNPQKSTQQTQPHPKINQQSSETMRMHTCAPTLTQITAFRDTHANGITPLLESKTLFLKAETLVTQERYAEAIDCFLAGFRYFEGMLDLSNFNTRLLAAIAVQHVLAEDQSHVNALLLDVFLNMLVRPFELSVVKLQRIVKKRRDDVAALVLTAAAMTKLAMFEDALINLDAALELEDPERLVPELHYQRGIVFSNLEGKDNRQRAVNNFAKYLEIVGIDGRRVPDAHYSIAGCFMELDNVRKVVEHFSKGLEAEAVRFPFFSISPLVNATLKASLTLEVKYMLVTGGSHIRQQHWSKIPQKYLQKVEGDDLASIAKECVACGSLGKTRTCAGCKETRYCSTNCQVAHWLRGHAAECSGIVSRSTR
ncbi:hypothetical protein HK096_006032 [Nowakowskiella sp. JEL0078]|nr:hypothetical protein HK096_006032 [Nowakowskiella sp. JEL0078]